MVAATANLNLWDPRVLASWPKHVQPAPQKNDCPGVDRRVRAWGKTRVQKDRTYAACLLRTHEWQTLQCLSPSGCHPWLAYLRTLSSLHEGYAPAVQAWAENCMSYPEDMRAKFPCLHYVLSCTWLQLQHLSSPLRLLFENGHWASHPLSAQWDNSCEARLSLGVTEMPHDPSTPFPQEDEQQEPHQTTATVQEGSSPAAAANTSACGPAYHIVPEDTTEPSAQANFPDSAEWGSFPEMPDSLENAEGDCVQDLSHISLGDLGQLFADTNSTQDCAQADVSPGACSTSKRQLQATIINAVSSTEAAESNWCDASVPAGLAEPAVNTPGDFLQPSDIIPASAAELQATLQGSGARHFVPDLNQPFAAPAIDYADGQQTTHCTTEEASPRVTKQQVYQIFNEIFHQYGAEQEVSIKRLKLDLEASFTQVPGGDQAYWRFRHAGTPPFQTGEIALIRSQKLCQIPQNGFVCQPGAMLVVVSDAYVKWRGGYQPSSAEEVQGHWCAAIGQLPVLVDGPVACRDFIAASLTCPPAGQHADPSDPAAMQRIVAFALEDKTTDGLGHVHAFVLFGLGIVGMMGSHTVDAVTRQLKDLKESFTQTDHDLRAQLTGLGSRLDAQERVIASMQAMHISTLSIPARHGKELLYSKPACELVPTAAEALITSPSRLNMLSTFGQQQQLVGREGLLEQLANLFKGNAARNILLVGGPGVGKTSLARACAQSGHDRKDLDCVYVAKLTGVDTVDEALALIKEAIEYGQGRVVISQATAEAQRRQPVTRQLCQLLQIHVQQKVLLFLDNADDIIGKKEFQMALNQLQACLGNVTALSTSRSGALFPSMPVEVVEVQPLDAAQYPELDPTVARQLAEQCGNIPIALKVVASTVELQLTTAEEAQAPRPADMAYSQTASPSEAPQPRLNMLQGAYASFGQQGQLIGREELQAKLTDLLKDPHRRHTVLVGGPGMLENPKSQLLQGKTSLAIACAQAMQDNQDLDCIYAASLRGIATVEGAFAEIRQTIDQGQGRLRTFHTPAQMLHTALVAQLCQLLRIHAQQKVLLILDNADGVLGCNEFQNALDQLQGCLSNVTLLSTSRLRALYLDIPPPQFLELQPLTQEEAQRLLCRVCPQLKDEPFMAEQLAKQCGSIPIALKVVANTIEQLEVTAEDMLQTLAKMGLIRGAEQLGDDNRLLRDCITLSLNSDQSEQARLAQLSIFPAAFDTAAAAAVLNVDQLEASVKLDALWRRSLVSKGAVTPRSSKKRYMLHLLIRDLSAEGAEGQADFASAQHRFMRYFLDLWSSAKADTEESQQRLQLQRQNVAKAVELLAAQQQPLADFQAYCNLGDLALDSVYNARLDMPTVIAALSKLRAWAQAANDADAILGSREQLAYLQSRDPKEAKNARDELQQIQTDRTAASGSNSASLTLCLEGLANAAVTMRCNGQLTTDEANAVVDECREEKYHILMATCGGSCAATLRAAGWMAYGLPDTDDSIEQLSVHLKSATETLTACHPATLAIQSQFAQQLSQGTHRKVCSCAALCKQLLALEQQNFDDDPKSVILAWLDHHAKQCEERFTSLADETVLAILSFGTAMTRCTRPEQQQAGLEKVEQGMRLGEQCWGKNDEWLLDSRLDRHVTALQCLWRLDDAMAIVKDTLQLSKQAYGETTTYITECMQLEAKLLQCQGKYHDAQTVLEKAAQHHLKAQQGPSDQNSSNMSLLMSGIPLDLANNLSLQGRHKQASSMHGFAYKMMASNAADQCDIFSRHSLGMATTWRRQGNLTNAEELLQQAEKHHIHDDCDASDFALEQARWHRDSGQVDAALVQFKELYTYVVQCDGDTKLIAIEAALEAAWLHFLKRQLSEAQWWFTEACCIVDSLQRSSRESCNFLAAISSSGLAAVQLQAQSACTIATSISDTEILLCQPHPTVDGCQIAHLYLAICHHMLGNGDKAQQHYADAMHTLSELYTEDHVYAIACRNVYRRLT